MFLLFIRKVNGSFLLELESGLDIGHDVGRLLQLLDLGGSQDLLHHGGDAIGVQDARQRQEHILIDAVLALENKEENILILY